MTTFLVLVGLALFAGAAAMSIAYAARHDPKWIAGTLLFPVVIPLYYRRHWEELHVAALVQAAGLVMIVAGLLITQFGAADPDGLAAAPGGELAYTPDSRQQSGFVDSERALRLLVAHRESRELSGRLHGRPFRPDRVELIDGALRLIEGRGFFPEREIAIDFSGHDIDPQARVRRTISPGTQAPPTVMISWLDDDGRPVSEIIRHGYRLDLELVPLSEGRLAGHLQITLPDLAESYAGGEFVAQTNFLRYDGEVVDRNFDHEDTLRHVGDVFLQTQYEASGIDGITYDVLTMDSLHGTGEATAAVLLADGREARHVLKFAKGSLGWGVQVPESAAATEAAGFVSVYRVLPASAEEQVRHRPASSPEPSRVTEREAAFGELAGLSGRGAVVEYRNGRREEGVLRGMRKGRLVLETVKAGGKVEYQLAETDIAAVRLASGEVLRLAGTKSAVSPQAVPAVTAAAALPVQETALKVAGVDLGPLMNRSVRVTAQDGKVTVGVLRGVNARKRLVVETQVGGGKIDYTVPVDQVSAIEPAAR